MSPLFLSRRSQPSRGRKKGRISGCILLASGIYGGGLAAEKNVSVLLQLPREI